MSVSCFILSFETGSHCITQAGLELEVIPLPQPPKCEDDRMTTMPSL